MLRLLPATHVGAVIFSAQWLRGTPEQRFRSRSGLGGTLEHIFPALSDLEGKLEQRIRTHRSLGGKLQQLFLAPTGVDGGVVFGAHSGFEVAQVASVCEIAMFLRLHEAPRSPKSPKP